MHRERDRRGYQGSLSSLTTMLDYIKVYFSILPMRITRYILMFIYEQKELMIERSLKIYRR